MSATNRALLAEVVGSFFFFSIGAGSIVANELSGGDVGLVGVALAHGVALSVAVSMFASTSGGHFNPAVSFGLAIARAFPWRQVGPYWVAQLVGALAAGVFLRLAFPEAVGRAALLGTPALGKGIDPLAGTFVEAVLTFFLVLAVFATAVVPSAPRIAGFGIGLTVLVDILVGGPLTGAAMNPARHFGPALVAASFDNWWVYWAGPLAGGAIAALVWRAGLAPVAEPVRERS